jgi:hypothetical protein
MNASECHHRSTLKHNQLKTCFEVALLAEDLNLNPNLAFEELCKTCFQLKKTDFQKIGFFGAFFEFIALAMSWLPWPWMR